MDAMTEMNPVSAGGFSSAAGHYAKVRPAYARGAVGRINETIPPGPVLDVAAGTGILTGQMLRAGREVVAVEPLAEMLAQFVRALPRTPAVSAVAESLPFSGSTFSGLTIAQAFHWMDCGAALAEAHRVLQPGGVLVLVFNARDESVPWVRELTDLVEQRSGGRPYSDHRDRSWEDLVDGVGGFDHISTDRFANPVPASPELVLERVRSTSFVAVMEPGARESLLEEARVLIARHADTRDLEHFEYPHDTVVYQWRRAAPEPAGS